MMDYKRIHCIYRAYEKVSTNPDKYKGKGAGVGDLHTTMPVNLQNDINVFYNALSNFEKSLRYNSMSRKSYPGRVIINPFQFHYENANYDLNKLGQIERRWNKSRLDFYKRSRLGNEMEYISQACFMLFMASVDGLINLLYHLYMKKQIKEDKELINKISFEKIHLRIRRVSLYCNNFRDLKKEDNALNELAKLMEIRNKLVHANITEVDYRNIIEEDSFLFYINRQTSELGSTVNPMTFTSEDLVGIRKVIINTIKFILSSMEKDSRSQLKSVLNAYYIGYVTKNEVIYFVQEKLYD
jgi:hypothetical protein